MINIKHNGVEITLKFGAKAIKAIEQAAGKAFQQIGELTKTEAGYAVIYSVADVEAFIKGALQATGDYSSDDIMDMLDGNPGLFTEVVDAAGSAWLSLRAIATAGNSAAPEKKDTSENTSGD